MTRRGYKALIGLGLIWVEVAVAAAGGDADGAVDCVINPRSTIEIGSHEDGILSEVTVVRGDVVRKGGVIARLENDVERLTVELSRVRATSDVDVRSSIAQERFREREVQRLVEPLNNKTIARNVYDQAVIEHELAGLALEAAKMEHEMAQIEFQRARAQLERRVMRSPVNGVIVDVGMHPGEYIHEQSPLLTIAEIDPLNVEVFLPVAKYGQVHKGQKAVVMPEAPVGGEYEATVTVVDNVFDAASRTFGIRLELPNAGLELPAGLRCTVTFTP